MTTLRTDREKLREAIELLRGVNQKNREFEELVAGLKARIQELEALPSGLSQEDAAELRRLGYWRDRANLLGGVVAAATKKQLPSSNPRLAQFLGENFIDSAKVETMKATAHPRTVGKTLADIGQATPVPEEEDEGNEDGGTLSS